MYSSLQAYKGSSERAVKCNSSPLADIHLHGCEGEGPLCVVTAAAAVLSAATTSDDPKGLKRVRVKARCVWRLLLC